MKRRFISTALMLACGLLAVAWGMAGCNTRSHEWAYRSMEAPYGPQMPSANGSFGFGRPGMSGAGSTRTAQPVAVDPMRVDELWVIQKPEATPPQPAPSEEMPRSGALLARPDETGEMVGFPLKHTDVRASIAGYVATVDVTQQYHNPYPEKIEAVYVFPLPADSAVTDFIMSIGERQIRGIIRERAEAQRIYQEARSHGYVASLLTQERPNIFTQSVANIEPGRQIDINIKYFHTLAYVDGWYEFVFPMVVGPRFNPPGSTDGIGAVGIGQPGRSGQATEVQYLKPGQRSGHDIALSLQIDAGVNIEEIDSRNHEVELVTPEPGVAQVKLAAADSIPNKDFVLRYRVAGRQLKSAMMAQRDPDGSGGCFTIMLFPPQATDDLPRKPLELFFTLDVSGSMSGRPMEQSKAAIRYALQNMRADDTFQVVRFAGSAETLFSAPRPATASNIRAALRYIDDTRAGGGTMMIERIRAALNHPHDGNRLRFVCFLTDGYIGNEAEILREIHNLRGPSRIFSFGVGSSPNRFLMDHMARFGHGAVAYLGLQDRAEDVMRPFFDRIAHPAMTDIEIDWNGLDVQEVYPRRTPDLFVGRPVILTGRYSGSGAVQEIIVRGKIGNQPHEMRLPLRLEQAAAHNGIRSVWARAKIADLSDRATYEANPDLPAEICQVALAHNLVSAYTSFVAVDASRRTAGTHGTTIAVPVPMPDGVRYETTVEETQ